MSGGYSSPDFLTPFNARGNNAANDGEMYDSLFGTQRETGALNASNELTWNFAYPFTNKPVISHMYEESAEGLPVVLKVKAWTVDGNGRFTSVVVRGYRFQNLPVLNNVGGLLTAVIDGVNTIVQALSGRSIISSASLQGLVIHLEAGKRSSS